MTSLEEQFKSYDIHTPVFSMNGIETYCRIVDIIDGDSVMLIVPLFGQYYKFNARLKGIDTFEIKSHDNVLKEKALLARKKVFEIVCKEQVLLETDRKHLQEVLNKNVYIVWVKCYEYDKYGRLLCDLYCSQNDEKSISDKLIELKLAYPYFGGTKKTEKEQLLL